MTLSPWLIYFADLADSIINMFNAITFIDILLVSAGIFTVWYADANIYNNEKEEKIKKIGWKIFKRSFVFLPILIIINTLLPSTNTLYKMMVVPVIINSQVVQKLPDELQLFIDKELMISGPEKGEKPSE